ncbi:M23 family peptidase [Romboutsia weinsteinii]|uniref:M23 family peptidase n=1 Tax=Romboutsia weinsteinii TaxID=2020949 RepID=A0A371IYK4_9FIRM|nr:M23 family metallopeptidase [Romboutsia weinsteinii]RDY25550.1 M23 family peptidase [Romboutsia weinsteinii]
MKKKLLEKDGFYLALFACICLVAVGGVWFTNNNVNKLASNNGLTNDEDEIHLIDKNKDKDSVVPATTDSDKNLEKAKSDRDKKETNAQNDIDNNSKLSFIGSKVIREYSEKEPSYSKTLDVWEIHKGIDVSAKKGAEVKSILNGTVSEVFEDDEYGTSVKVISEDKTVVVYSGLDENIKVVKNDKIKEGQCIGLVGNTTKVESEDGSHVHVEAYKDEKSINPMDLLK